MLSHASIPIKFWNHAFLTAVYLINRLSTTSLNGVVPYTILFKQDPDYKFLKVFGCACFPFLRPYNKNKLDFRSQECLFLGYSTSHKGYKCLNSDGRLYIFRDVPFNEHRFSYQELFHSARVKQVQQEILASIPLVSHKVATLQHSLPSHLSTSNSVIRQNTPTPTINSSQHTNSAPSSSSHAHNTPEPATAPTPITSLGTTPNNTHESPPANSPTPLLHLHPYQLTYIL